MYTYIYTHSDIHTHINPQNHTYTHTITHTHIHTVTDTHIHTKIYIDVASSKQMAEASYDVNIACLIAHYSHI